MHHQRYDEALDDLYKALDLDVREHHLLIFLQPESAATHYYIAFCYKSQGKLEEALNVLNKVSDMLPKLDDHVVDPERHVLQTQVKCLRATIHHMVSFLYLSSRCVNGNI